MLTPSTSTDKDTPKNTFTHNETTFDVGSLDKEAFDSLGEWNVVDNIFAYKVGVKQMGRHPGEDITLMIFFPVMLIPEHEKLSEEGAKKVEGFQQFLKHEMECIRFQRVRYKPVPTYIDIQLPPTDEMLEELRQTRQIEIPKESIGTIQEPLKAWLKTTWGPAPVDTT